MLICEEILTAKMNSNWTKPIVDNNNDDEGKWSVVRYIILSKLKQKITLLKGPNQTAAIYNNLYYITKKSSSAAALKGRKGGIMEFC